MLHNRKALIGTIVLLAVLCACALSLAETSGTCGENMTWTLDDAGKLTISGTGEMKPYASRSLTYVSNPSPWGTGVTSVIIENGVTSIGSYAFDACKNLTNVTLSTTINTIGRGVFSECSNLTSITLPDSITTISDGAFANCTAARYATIGSETAKTLSKANYNYTFRVAGAQYDLKYTFKENEVSELAVVSADADATDIEIADGVTTIGNNAFTEHTALKSILIPESVISIGNRAFYGCTGITSITIPKYVVSIGNEAFSGCTGLASVTLSDSLQAIQDKTFSGCTGLTSITVPNQAVSIGKEAFSGCTGLADVALPDSLQTINEYAFQNCSSLNSITLPDHMESIWGTAFDKCPAIVYAVHGSETAKRISSFRPIGTNYNIHESGTIDGISKATFISADQGATEIIVPDYITEIKNNAFYECPNLTSVTISANLEKIDFITIFKESTTLEKIEISASNPSYASIDGIVYSKDGSNVVYCPRGKTEAKIPNTVTSIDQNAFTNCIGLKKITIDAKMTQINFNTVFKGCNNLENVVFPADHRAYQSIDGVVFNREKTLLVYCPRGRSGEYTVPDGTEKIGISACEECVKLTNIIFAESVTTIGEYETFSFDGPFLGCTGLESITIPANVKIIGEKSFANCTGLKKVVLSAVEGIGTSAFEDCVNLESIELPVCLGVVGKSAFAGCSALKSVTVYKRLTYIGSGAFDLTTLIKAPKDSYAAKWAYDHYYEVKTFDQGSVVTITSDGNGTGTANPASGIKGTVVKLSATPKAGYKFKEWVVISGNVKIEKNQFTIGEAEVEIRATFEQLAAGDSFSIDGMKYQITDGTNVAFAGLEKAKSKENVEIPATVKFGGKTYKVTAIAEKAMYKDTKVKTVNIGKNVKTINKNAFASCTNLNTVKGAASLTGIGDGAFSGCKKLATLPGFGKLKSIGAEAFKKCVALKKLTLAKSVNSIGKKAFNGCKNLDTITIKTTNLNDGNIGDGAFKGMSKKATATCPKSKLNDYSKLLVQKGMEKTTKFKK